MLLITPSRRPQMEIESSQKHAPLTDIRIQSLESLLDTEVIPLFKKVAKNEYAFKDIKTNWHRNQYHESKNTSKFSKILSS